MPLPGPPLEYVHGRRYVSHMVAYSTCGFDGSIASVTAPVLSSTNSTFSQCLPPSVVLYTPRSGLGAHTWPSAAAYTTSGLRGSIAIQLMTCVCSRPTWLQVLPPSLDLYIPSPVRKVLRIAGSPVPA